MSSNAQPTEQQLKPMVEDHRNFWSSFTKAIFIGALGVVALLALMATFLVKH
jgi:hypothetical protein